MENQFFCPALFEFPIKTSPDAQIPVKSAPCMGGNNASPSPETIESWDSFNSYVLLDELESEFNTEFTIDEVVETKNVSDIKKYLKIHGIELND